ncbi:MAG: TetR/AcrR family transcriptional regulator [Solirubrobacteraceae bacterium]|nr:TetR/AcrR family transcriptional regulator [Solirubrobacteraceae bacterium]
MKRRRASQRTERRTRLSVESRQEAILEAAERVFARQPYESAQIDEVAKEAGVSASLVYHYFANKRVLFTAVATTGIERFARATAPDPALPPEGALRAGLEHLVAYVDAHEHSYRALHRARESGNEDIRRLLDELEGKQVARVSAALFPSGDVPAALPLAVRGAIAFDVAACLAWLDTHRPISREALVSLLEGNFLGALNAATRQ